MGSNVAKCLGPLRREPQDGRKPNPWRMFRFFSLTPIGCRTRYSPCGHRTLWERHILSSMSGVLGFVWRRKSSSARIIRSPAFVTPGPSMSSTPPWRCRGSTPMATASTPRRSSSRSPRSMSNRSRSSTTSPSCISAMPTTILPLKPPEDYWLDYDKSLLTLHFTLPLATPLDPKGKEVDGRRLRPHPSSWPSASPRRHPVKIVGHASVQGCGAEIKQPDPESEEDAKALSESFFSQLGPNSNFGSQFAQTVTIKCSDATEPSGACAPPRSPCSPRLLLLVARAGCRAGRDASRQSAPSACPAPSRRAPSAFAPPTAAPLHAPGPFGALFSWVVDTQQSAAAPARRRREEPQDRQRDGRRGDARRAQLPLWRGACRGPRPRQDDHLLLCRRQ